MKEEYIDILDENGEKTGRSDTYENVHKNGMPHRSAHVWLINSKKEILIQKRQNNKIAYPNYWDISAAGHVSSGETGLEGAMKETREELGIEFKPDEFKFLSTIRVPFHKIREDFIENEFNDVYVINTDTSVESFILQKEEVEEVKWIDKEEFKKWIKGEGPLLVPHEEEYNLLLRELDK